MQVTAEEANGKLDGIKVVVNDYIPDNTIVVNRKMYEALKKCCAGPQTISPLTHPSKGGSD